MKKAVFFVCIIILMMLTLVSCNKITFENPKPQQTEGETIYAEQTTQMPQDVYSTNINEPTSQITTQPPSTTKQTTTQKATTETSVTESTTASISQEKFSPSSTTANYEVYSSIKYGTDEKQVMDIYVPLTAYQRKFNGAILYIHGGSWTGGDKTEMEARSIEYAEKGYITANMNYRLYTEGGNITGISMVSDVDNAIKMLKNFSDEKTLNITKLATSGYSAGGHISMLYTYANTNPQKGKELNIIKPAIKIVFTANQVGPSDFRAGVWGNGTNDTGLNLGQLLSGYTLTKVENEKVVLVADEKTVEYALNLVSPATHVTSSAVPSLFGYAGNDYIVPPGNRESIINACKNADIRHDLVMYPRSGHMLLFDPKSDSQYKELLDEYCLTYFGY